MLDKICYPMKTPRMLFMVPKCCALQTHQAPLPSLFILYMVDMTNVNKG